MRSVGWVSCFAVTFATVPSAGGQTAVTVRAGARVQITRANTSPPVLRTSLVLLEQDSVMVRGGDVDTAIALDPRSIVRFELSRGKHPAATIGAPLVGAALGALVAPLLITETERCSWGLGTARQCEKLTSDEVVGVIVGALAFSLAARAIARERWREIPLDHLFWDVRPGQPFRVGVSLDFPWRLGKTHEP